MTGGLTRTTVCRLLGVSEKSLYAWEKSGRISRPARDHRGWRAYSEQDIEAIRRLLGKPPVPGAAPPTADAEPLAPGPSPTPGAVAGAAREPLLGLTARNQLQGVVVALRCEGLMAEVTLRLGDGQEIVSIVTAGSIRRLGLREGARAAAIIKATEVMLHR